MVVVFPFVPVIARTSPFPKTYASSISPQIGSPFSRISFTIGRSVGTPGLITTRESLSRSSSFLSPSSVPRTISSDSLSPPSIFARISSGFSLSLPSYNTTFASSFKRSSHAASPLIPEPNTNTFLSFTTILLYPHKSNQAKDCRNDRKYSYNSRLRPSAQLKVMMDRSHLKESLSACLLKICYLQNY